MISSVFDPLGYYFSTVLDANLFMKTLWMEKYEWDAKVNEKHLKMWLQVIEALKDIPLCHLLRYIFITKEKPVVYSLVCFCDASTKAYATVIYLHQSFSSSCKVDLIFLKTRLTPQKMTIPRLESSHWSTCPQICLHLQITNTIVFTDSMCVLHWLQSKKPLSAFVTSRVKEIKPLEEVTFKHVSSEDNPADLATRGKSPKELTSSIWWMGPTWLKKNSKNSGQFSRSQSARLVMLTVK